MKNTTLRQLVLFETVARHRHFTRAADALDTTQPSVSTQIKQSEDNLGVALFEQNARQLAAGHDPAPPVQIRRAG